MPAKTFDTVDVLSCSTGNLFGDMGGIHQVAEFLTGSNVWTHQLVLLAEPMSRVLRRAISNLPGPEDAVGVTSENFAAYRDRWLAQLGPKITLPEELFGTLSVMACRQ